MKICVLFNSVYGNTQKIAIGVANGMARTGGDAAVIPVTQAEMNEIRESGLIAVGAPSSFGGTSKMKNFFKKLKAEGITGKPCAVFDTRMEGKSKGAADKLKSMAKDAGLRVLLPSFGAQLEESKGPLVPGEFEKSETWGESLARQVVPRRAPTADNYAGVSLQPQPPTQQPAPQYPPPRPAQVPPPRPMQQPAAQPVQQPAPQQPAPQPQAPAQYRPPQQAQPPQPAAAPTPPPAPPQQPGAPQPPAQHPPQPQAPPQQGAPQQPPAQYPPQQPGQPQQQQRRPPQQ